MDRDINDVDSYTEASTPTPPNQEDVSALDLVSDAVEKVIDNVRDGLGLNKENLDNNK
ncbi:hypothetical protein [Cohnella sp.]|uniref:hypothetical protein n=1 Tax=Cohnella sp. TaxID=1883426 RepID=UPI003568535D